MCGGLDEATSRKAGHMTFEKKSSRSLFGAEETEKRASKAHIPLHESAT